jgi:hypothetical protein
MLLTNRTLSQLAGTMSAAMRSAAAGLKSVKRDLRLANEGVVICVVRDEAELLPHFLRHYRAAGVKHFAFLDNASVDATQVFLADQPDCDVFHHSGSFRSAVAGMAWKNLLIQEYPGANWYLSVDADEFAVYDGWPETSFDDLASCLGRAGRSAATALMVDMYGAGAIAAARLSPEKSLVEICPCFDGDGYAIAVPADWRAGNFPRLDARGGPMMRLFGEEAPGWMAKTPLVLEPGILYHDPHTIHPVALNLALPHIALLHFRFLGSVADKIRRVAERRMHSAGNTSTYLKLAERLERDPEFSLAYSRSERFTSPRQFVDRRMIEPLPA